MQAYNKKVTTRARRLERTKKRITASDKVKARGTRQLKASGGYVPDGAREVGAVELSSQKPPKKPKATPRCTHCRGTTHIAKNCKVKALEVGIIEPCTGLSPGDGDEAVHFLMEVVDLQ